MILATLTLISAGIFINIINVTSTISEPISPTSIYGTWSNQPTGGCPFSCADYLINNNASVDENTIISFEEIQNPFGAYETNTPFNQTLIPGDNNINFCIRFIACQAAGFVEGNIKINR